MTIPWTTIVTVDVTTPIGKAMAYALAEAVSYAEGRGYLVEYCAVTGLSVHESGGIRVKVDGRARRDPAEHGQNYTVCEHLNVLGNIQMDYCPDCGNAITDDDRVRLAGLAALYGDPPC